MDRRQHRERQRIITHLAGGLASLGFTSLAWHQLGKTGESLPRLAIAPDSEAVSPRTAYIVPARNEASNIRYCLLSLVNQIPPPAGIYVVDDNSIDDTALIVAALAVQHPFIRLIHGTPRPHGWAGKNWALQQGIEAAAVDHWQHAYDWIVLTDADTWHHPMLLTSAQHYNKMHHLDLLSIAPSYNEPSNEAVILRAGIGEFYSYFFGADYPRYANMSNHPAALAMGQFIMIQGRLLVQMGGYDQTGLRSRLDDDRALAQQIQAGGRTIGIVAAPDLLTTVGYASFQEAWRGHAHHLLPTVSPSPIRLTAALGITLLVNVLPLAGLLWGLMVLLRKGWRAAWLPLVRWSVQLAAVTLVRQRAARLATLPEWYPLAAPFGALATFAMVLLTVGRALLGHTVHWKGRDYSALSFLSHYNADDTTAKHHSHTTS